MFSDDARAPRTYAASTRNWGRFSSTGNPNEVTLTLFDQYGDTYSGTSSVSYRFTLTPSGGTAVVGNVASNGRARIVYTNPATVRSEEPTDSVIAVEANTGTDGAYEAVTGVTAAPAASTIYWAEPGSAASSTGAIVRVADPAARSIVVEGGTDDPEYYVFGTDDSFIVNGTALSFAQFMEVLNAANDSKISEITINTTSGSETMLAWDGYNAARPRDRAKWTLTAICASS